MFPCHGCQRHVLAQADSCPFCGAALATTSSPCAPALGAFAIATALLLGSSACATRGAVENEATSEASTTTSDTSTQESTESNGEWMDPTDTTDPSLSFYAPAEDLIRVTECDPFTQDCPEGEKCVPVNDSGGDWNTYDCVPILGDGQTGDPCTYDGPELGTDTCGASSLCLGPTTNFETGEGECVELCTGSAEDWICDPGTACLITNAYSITLCLPSCDPLLQDCAGDSSVCSWTGEKAFLCLWQITEPAALGEPCDGSINSCLPGGTCLGAEVLPACAGDSCCAEFCDLSDLEFVCAEPGATCQALVTEEPLPGYEEVGVCLAPPP